MKTSNGLKCSRWGRIIAVAALGAALKLPTAAHAQAGRDPASVKLITDDIGRFWQAFDARATLGTAPAIDSLYFKLATPGLKDWIRLRLPDLNAFATTVDRAAGYYASARASTLRIEGAEPHIREALATLKGLYPDAVFPDVYFVVGRLSSGGTTARSGLLIGAEMYGRTTDEALSGLTDWHKQVLATVDKVPAIVSHELVHYQQSIGGSTLLAQSLREGGADFVAELMTRDNINAHVHAWVHAVPTRERELWLEFQRDMLGRDWKQWFSSSDVNARPKDLGYFMGYQIAAAYYTAHGGSVAALKAILTTRDPEALLRDSGYAQRFSAPP